MSIRKRPYQFPSESRYYTSKKSAEVLTLKIPPSGISIHNNTFTTPALLYNPPLDNTNNFYSNSILWSIKLQNRLPGVTNAFVSNNQMNNQLKGIYLNGCEQVEIDANHIQLIGSANLTKQYGIWLVNSPNCTISNDSIVALNSTTDPTLSRGIRFESSTGCTIKENYLMNLGSGLNGLHVCDQTQLSCNEIYNCARGIDVFDITLPVQGSVGNPQDNKWYNISLVNRTVGSGSPIEFHFRGNQHSATNKFSPGTLTQILISDSVTFGPSPCQNNTDTLPQMFSELADGIVIDSIFFPLYNEENKWFAKEYAFKLLSKDSMLMNQGLPTDSQRQRFFDDLKSRNIGHFDEIQKALKEKDYLSAITKILSIQPENLIEENLKTVYSKLERLQNDESALTLDDSLELDDVGSQLACEGGPAVFIARAILDEEYDDELNGSLLRESSASTNDEQVIELYPNPSSGKITIASDFSAYLGCDFEVYDFNGRLNFNTKFETRQNLIAENLEFLKNGTYFLIVSCDKVLVKQWKLIIAK